MFNRWACAFVAIFVLVAFGCLLFLGFLFILFSCLGLDYIVAALLSVVCFCYGIVCTLIWVVFVVCGFYLWFRLLGFWLLWCLCLISCWCFYFWFVLWLLCFIASVDFVC